jgi:parallel beta-helix repeat protein
MMMPLASVSFAGTAYYVDLEATSSTNLGTYAQPFKTIAAVNSHAMSTGDDVYFKAGMDAKIDAYLNIDWDGSESDRVVIGAYYGDGQFGLNGGERPILDGDTNSDGIGDVPAEYSWPGIINYSRNSASAGYVTVRDLNIRYSGGKGIAINCVYGAEGYHNDHNEVLNCVVYRSFRQGITIGRGSYNLIEGNYVFESSYGRIFYGPTSKVAGAGIETSGMDTETLSIYNVIRNNTVIRGFEGIGNYKGARYTVMEGNTAYDSQTYNLYVSRSRNVTVRNNLTYATSNSRATTHSGGGRGSGIVIQCEDNYEGLEVSGWETIHGNRIAGFSSGIKILDQAGIDQKYNEIYNNRIVDCEDNILFGQNDSGWEGNEIHDNYFYIFTSGGVHSTAMSPLGVTWATNHYNTDIVSVSGNAATTAVYDDPDLVKTTGWRDLTGGAVTRDDFLFVGEGTDTCQSLGYICCSSGTGTGPQSAYDGDCEAGQACYESCPATDTALDTSNLYGGAGGTFPPLRIIPFNDGTGSAVATDYSGNGGHATLTLPDWVANGIRINTTGQAIAVPVPNLGDKFSMLLVVTSLATEAEPYAKYISYYNTSVRDLQIERNLLDTLIRLDSGGISAFYDVPDIIDLQTHFIVATVDRTVPRRCVYIDGSLQGCDDQAWTNPTWAGNLYLGGKSDGTWIINGVLHFYGLWSGEFTASDAASLSTVNGHVQMLINPPARTFNLPSLASRVGRVNMSMPRVRRDGGMPVVRMVR